jgi:hypothetical protein
MTSAGSFRRRLMVGSLLWIFGFLAITTAIALAIIHRYPHLVGFVHNSALIVFATVCLVGGCAMVASGAWMAGIRPKCSRSSTISTPCWSFATRR